MWKIVNSDKDRRPNELPECLGASGLGQHISLSTLKTEMDFVNLFLGDIWPHVVQCVNKKGKKLFTEHEQLFQTKWQDTTIYELQHWFALLLLMGISYKPSISLYWSNNILYSSDIFKRPNVMKKCRFLLILQCLCFIDEKEFDPKNQLSRIQPLFRLAKEKLSTVYCPEQDLVVSETVLKNKGVVRRHDSDTRGPRAKGLSVFCLSDICGYLLEFEFYSGPKCTANWASNVPESSSLSSNNRIAVHLLQRAGLLDLGYHCIVNKSYNSVWLQEFLLERNTTCSGLVTKNSGLPDNQLLCSKQLTRNEARFFRKRDILSVPFKNTDGVCFLSSKYEAGPCVETNSTKRNIPDCFRNFAGLADYSKKVESATTAESVFQDHQATRRAFKWHKKLAIFIMQKMVYNAFLLFRKFRQSKSSFLTFEEAYISAVFLIEYIPIESRMITVHVPQHIPPTPGTNRPRRRCRHCYANNQTRMTRINCRQCPGNPSLCIGHCWHWYHQNHRSQFEHF